MEYPIVNSAQIIKDQINHNNELISKYGNDINFLDYVKMQIRREQVKSKFIKKDGKIFYTSSRWMKNYYTQWKENENLALS